MIEKHALKAEMNVEDCFEFIRFAFKGQDLKTKRNLENVFLKIKENAALSVFGSIQAAMQAKNVDEFDYLTGMVAGIALALSSARPEEEGSIKSFLDMHWSNKPNVADISEAFRKGSLNS